MNSVLYFYSSVSMPYICSLDNIMLVAQWCRLCHCVCSSLFVSTLDWQIRWLQTDKQIKLFPLCTFLGFCMCHCVSAHLCQNQSLKCTGRSNPLCTRSLTLPTSRSSGTSLSLRATRFDSPSHIWILKLLRTATTTHLQSDPYFNTYTELP